MPRNSVFTELFGDVLIVGMYRLRSEGRFEWFDIDWAGLVHLAHRINVDMRVCSMCARVRALYSPRALADNEAPTTSCATGTVCLSANCACDMPQYEQEQNLANYGKRHCENGVVPVSTFDALTVTT